MTLAAAGLFAVSGLIGVNGGLVRSLGRARDFKPGPPTLK
jgi:hypothetical protein